jgi:hypothetical protein
MTACSLQRRLSRFPQPHFEVKLPLHEPELGDLRTAFYAMAELPIHAA